MRRSRVFSREFKLAAVSRMQSGENVSALSRLRWSHLFGQFGGLVKVYCGS